MVRETSIGISVFFIPVDSCLGFGNLLDISNILLIFYIQFVTIIKSMIVKFDEATILFISN